MRGFIYKITNNVNGKVYVGQTKQNVRDRFYRHCSRIGSTHELNMAIHKAIRKYGKQNFTLEVIEETENLNEREKYWIAFYDSYKTGYNSTLGGQNGYKPFKEEHTSEIIEKYKEGKSLREIGKLFNLDKQTVKGLLLRNKVAIRSTRTYKLSQEDRAQILKEVAEGQSRKEIMRKWVISKSYLSQLINGYRRI